MNIGSLITEDGIFEKEIQEKKGRRQKMPWPSEKYKDDWTKVLPAKESSGR